MICVKHIKELGIMGVRILQDTKNRQSCLYCSTSGWAFGPVFGDEDEAAEFIQWYERHFGDPRKHSNKEIEVHHSAWLKLTHQDNSGEFLLCKAQQMNSEEKSR